MDILQIVGFALTALVLLIVLREYKREYAVVGALLASTLLLLVCISQIKEIVDFLIVLSSTVSENLPMLPLIKSIGIAIVISLACDICEDSGEKALANKLVFVGKIAILSLALPLASELARLM